MRIVHSRLWYVLVTTSTLVPGSATRLGSLRLVAPVVSLAIAPCASVLT